VTERFLLKGRDVSGLSTLCSVIETSRLCKSSCRLYLLKGWKLVCV